ncbi:MAG: hypothetical protein IPJ97_08480 [Proteobacteria bacterium]|nr:hypothetical protein [Pseudomonadota bacterium]
MLLKGASFGAAMPTWYLVIMPAYSKSSGRKLIRSMINGAEVTTLLEWNNTV